MHRKLVVAIAAAVSLGWGASLESPEQFAGFRMGAEGKLVRWERIVEYMHKAAAASPRVRVEEAGKTTMGNPFVVVTVTSPANMAQLEEHRGLQRRLVYDRSLNDASAAPLLEKQRAVVLITCNIHSTEIASSQMALELVHRFATEDSPYVRHILENVILVLAPSANPDGQIMVTDWYNKNRGTPYEYSFMPELYHKYTGHDNNRDAFMNTQVESRILNRLTYKEWLPHVFYDEHQMGGSGARMFVPPFKDPINPNVQPVVWQLNGLFGYAMGMALNEKNYPGVISGAMYTSWWQGGFLMQAWWHNMAGLLTEVASANVASPVEQELARRGAPPGPELTREQMMNRDPRKPLPPPRDIEPRNTYPRPWMGGKWTLRDIVDYELTATWAALETAANNRGMIVRSIYRINRREIEAGEKDAPYAWVIPAAQHDPPVAARLAQILDELGVEVHQAAAAFEAGGKKYPAASYVVLMSQPYRAFAKDMLEAQKYPAVRGPQGVVERPYDVTGWTLPYQMGVEAVEIGKKFEAKLERMNAIPVPPGRFEGARGGAGFEIARNTNNSAIAVNRLLKAGHEVSWTPEGAVFVRNQGTVGSELEQWARQLGIGVKAVAAAPAGVRRLRQPRLGIYKSWAPSMDEGWTRWLLEQYEFPYTHVRPSNAKAGKLRDRYDVLLFADQSAQSLIKGVDREWIRPELRGGMGQEGVTALKEFVRAGGTLIAIGASTLLPIQEFPLPLKSAFRDLRPGQFSCPGSILRVFVDNRSPEAYGMPEETSAVFYNNVAFEPTPALGDSAVRVIAKYPGAGVLKSGWLDGEQYIADRIAAASVNFGKGRVILYGWAVQMRAQPHATFKLLFNGIQGALAE
ncbi:MAG: M14 family metallopeptidase [Bryobacteraceae bacterium]